MVSQRHAIRGLIQCIGRRGNLQPWLADVMQQRCRAQILQHIVAQAQRLAEQQAQHGNVHSMNTECDAARIREQMQAQITILRQFDDLLRNQPIRRGARPFGVGRQQGLNIVKYRHRTQNRDCTPRMLSRQACASLSGWLAAERGGATEGVTASSRSLLERSTCTALSFRVLSVCNCSSLTILKLLTETGGAASQSPDGHTCQFAVVRYQ